MKREPSIAAFSCAVIAFFSARSVAQQVSITFDDLPCATVVTNQYPEATFSSDAGFVNITACDYDLGTSLPNYLCTAAAGGSLTCSNTTTIDFTTPVNKLTFMAGGDDTAGITASVDVYENGVLAGTVPIETDGDFTTPHLVDLTAFHSVTRIVIDRISNGGGLGFDDFKFEQGGGSCTGDPGFTLSAPSEVGIGEFFDMCLGARPGDLIYLFVSLGTGPTLTQYGTFCLDFPPAALFTLVMPEAGRRCYHHYVSCDYPVGLTGYLQFLALGHGSGISNQISITLIDRGGCR